MKGREKLYLKKKERIKKIIRDDTMMNPFSFSLFSIDPPDLCSFLKESTATIMFPSFTKPSLLDSED
jgi:hypothetical protein